MRDEILKAKGRLATLQKTQKELRLEARALIKSIRDCLDPYEQDLTRINAGEARVSAERLERIVEQLTEIGGQVRDLEDDIG